MGLNPLVQRVFKGLFDRNKTSFVSLFMSVVVHRIVVPCERMAQVPSPHRRQARRLSSRPVEAGQRAAQRRLRLVERLLVHPQGLCEDASAVGPEIGRPGMAGARSATNLHVKVRDMHPPPPQPQPARVSGNAVNPQVRNLFHVGKNRAQALANQGGCHLFWNETLYCSAARLPQLLVQPLPLPPSQSPSQIVV